jgi:hypothetical protein
MQREAALRIRQANDSRNIPSEPSQANATLNVTA